MLNEYDYKVVYIPTGIKLSKDLKLYLKSYLIDEGILDDYVRFRRASYVFNNYVEDFGKLPPETQYLLNFPMIYPYLQDFHYYLLNQMFNSRRNKIYRLKSKLRFMFDNYDCVFLTFTFTDDVLASTDAKTRRTYVSRYLKNYGLYVANIDFGQDDKFTKREHYHAVVSSEVDFSTWSCGALNGEYISRKCPSALATYMNKLTSHAYKEGASSTRPIFSKSFAKFV